MTPAWLVPTARATPWQPLLAVAVCLAAVAALASSTGTWPTSLTGVVAACLAAAVVAGLRDRAAALLAAVPTSAAVRRARRLGLLVPAGLATWLSYEWVGHRLQPGMSWSWSLGVVAALTASAVAVAVWTPQRVAVAAGAATPLLWTAASRAGGDLEGGYAQVLLVWQHHPWIVTGVALAALAMGRNR